MTTTAHATNPADTTQRNDRGRRNDPTRRNQTGTARGAAEVSLPRLYALRAAYLIIAVGLALVKWPSLINHPQPWPLFEGVETCMLVALSLLWFLGVRYPLQLLPALLFELAWKIIWTIVVVVPLWRSDQLDPDTLYVFYTCLVVVIPAAVIPWRYVFTNYVTKRGDRWRSDTTARP